MRALAAQLAAVLRLRPLLVGVVLLASVSGRAAPALAQDATPRRGDSASCAEDGNSQIQINSGESGRGKRSVTRVRWGSGGCVVELDAEGEFALRADLGDVERLSSDGLVEISERAGRVRRRVEITADERGALTRRYSVNGEAAVWDADAQRWLAGLLVELERRTAFAAESRVPALLARGGAAAVLDEITRMPSDYAQRRYYTELLRSDSTRMDAAGLGRVFEHAGRELSSDYELAELLVQTAKVRRLATADRAAQGAYVRATSSIGSDYEHRRALTALLDATDDARAGVPDDAVAGAIFDAAKDIGSDYEAAELLIRASRLGLVRGVASRPFFTAVGEIGSAYERRRTLSALLDADSLSDELVAGVLGAAGGMDSDYERAELLLTVLRRHPRLSTPLREAYLGAADRIRSDHERRRVLSALAGGRERL